MQPVSRDINTIQRRIYCWKDTIEIAKTLPALQTTTKYKWNGVISPSKKVENSKVSVLNSDTLDVARDMIRRGLHPLVLNLADNCFPGGHVDAGSGAQEESLFRCTDLCTTLNLKTLPRGTYPLMDTEVLLTKNVSILKEPESRMWDRLEPRILVDVISCPGIRNPPCGPEGRFSADLIEILVKKIETIFQVALANGNDAVVLGGLGCGAWRCPSQHVAEIMHFVTRNWRSAFAEISYAVLSGTDAGYIINDRKHGPDNYEVFSSYFSSFSISV
jgi:uncharacterized protein (TIGR02452 family)